MVFPLMSSGCVSTLDRKHLIYQQLRQITANQQTGAPHKLKKDDGDQLQYRGNLWNFLMERFLVVLIIK